MPITDFFADPNKVKPNDIMTLHSTFTEDDGTVIYEISDNSAITFVDGQRQLESDIQEKKDSTTTTLEGPRGTVRVAAYRKDKPDDKVFRVLRLI